MNVKLLTEIVEKADKDFALALVPADTLEKFAELLVKECVEYYRSQIGETSEPHTKTLKHFGVK